VEQPAEKRKLPDGTGTVSLKRDVPLKFSPTESDLGDHMTVQYARGKEENIVVVKGSGTTKLKRLVMHVDFSNSTPAMPPMTASRFSLADLDEADEQRLLKIYKMFEKKKAGK
jgi:hypothetical protein